MNTLEFKSNCPECGNICLRDFWVSETETQTMDIYDINGSTFTSRTKSTYDQVEIAGTVFKVQSVRENSMFGNTTYVYNLPAPVPPSTSAKFTQPVGKVWESASRWYYTGNLPFVLNWGFDRNNPKWSHTIGV